LKCWICGNNADSGEHMIKRSDLKMLFGSATQEEPLYYNSTDKKNFRIGSLNNWRLKSQSKICSYCNNTRTQPFDRAWEKMSKALSARVSELEIGDRIRANQIFQYDTRQQMLNLHLFFVKLFGCYISSASIPIDIIRFSESLIETKNHKNVYLRIGLDTVSSELRGASHSDVQAVVDEQGSLMSAAWYYQIGGVVVSPMYVQDGLLLDGMKDAWHPKYGSSNFRIADCFYGDERN
jgi:hypothetical protein